MKNSIQDLLGTLKHLSEIRYKSERQYLEAIERVDLDVGNKLVTDYLQSSIKFGKFFSESRHNLEKSFFAALDRNPVSAETGAPNNSSGVSISQPELVPSKSGTFKVKASPGAKVNIPLNVNNKFNVEQEVGVAVSKIQCLSDKKYLRSSFAVDKPALTLAPNSTEKVELRANLGAKSFQHGQVYQAELTIKGRDEKRFDLEISIDETVEKTEMKFTAPR